MSDTLSDKFIERINDTFNNKTFVTVAYLVMFSASSEIKCTVLNFFLECQYVNVACCLTLIS